jgi:hypothetical protein
LSYVERARSGAVGRSRVTLVDLGIGHDVSRDDAMTSPVELEAKATRLRAIAVDLRREATKVSGLLGPAKDLHSDETWQGPVAVEFSGTLTAWGKRTGSAQDAILGAAATFERDADNLDTQAGDQRREDREKEQREMEQREKEGEKGRR